MNHTPPPWELEGASIMHKEEAICIISSSTANAHLIAAAPELLEELEMILVGWKERSETRYLDDMTDWEKERFGFIEQVIAKARGRS